MKALRDFPGIVLAIQQRNGKTIFHPSERAQVDAGDFLIVMDIECTAWMRC